MENALEQSKIKLIGGMSRISEFWGFPRAMGAIYGALYLSPQHLSLDDLVVETNLSKGAISTNIRALERLGLVHKHVRVGDRRDFYSAEINFWKIIRGILSEREKIEFDLAIRTVGESLELAQSTTSEPSEEELVKFYEQRLRALQSFFNSLDKLVATVITLDELRPGTIERLLGISDEDDPENLKTD